MRYIFVSCLIALLGHNGPAQDIAVTFTATGEAISIDSITALNQSTNQTVSFPGDATLILKQSSGIQDISQPTDVLMIYPNPFSETSSVIVESKEPQRAILRIRNLNGQVVVQSEQNLQIGGNELRIFLSDNGLYVFEVEAKQGYQSRKLVNLSASGSESKIQWIGTANEWDEQSKGGGVKSLQTSYAMDYSEGDIINYTCYSGVMTTIVTDRPESPKNYEVKFADCTDPDGKHYKIVSIGNQTWMAENMAYLSVVYPSSDVSDVDQRIYVYGYEGGSLAEAKQQTSFMTYGVLYNYEAAKKVCPTNWHLPSDEEWRILEKYLGMIQEDLANGWRFSGDVGMKLKSINGWNMDGNGNNSVGFNAIPGGRCYYDGSFYNVGDVACFWSSTQVFTNLAWGRAMIYELDGVYRDYNSRKDGFSVRCLKDE